MPAPDPNLPSDHALVRAERRALIRYPGQSSQLKPPFWAASSVFPDFPFVRTYFAVLLAM